MRLIMSTPSTTSKHLELLEYEITDEPLENRHINKLPVQVREALDDLYDKAQHRPKEAIPELERLVATYPHIPSFYNHLSVAYLHAGDSAKAEELVLETYRRFPKYLFAKTNRAHNCLQKGEIEKIPGIFNHKFDLKLLYPHRKRFHLSEFVAFAGVMCRYFDAIGEKDTAALYYRALKRIAPRHPMTKHTKRVLYPPFWVRILSRWAKRLAEKVDDAEKRNHP